jgi:hypothetical protein
VVARDLVETYDRWLPSSRTPQEMHSAFISGALSRVTFSVGF